MTPEQLTELAIKLANDALGETDDASEAMSVLVLASAAVHLNCASEPTVEVYAQLMAQAIPSAYTAMRNKQ